VGAGCASVNSCFISHRKIHVRTPFDNELISFLPIWLLTDAPVPEASLQQATFNFESLPNQLIPVVFDGTQPLPVAVSLGLFAGRQEAIYQLNYPNASFLAFVLAGAFELEGRLLHEKDGLALWNATAIELEALNNNALLAVLELTQP
jgi:hypothetical protein